MLFRSVKDVVSSLAEIFVDYLHADTAAEFKCNIEELWDRDRFLALLWALVSKEFQNSTFFFVQLN